MSFVRKETLHILRDPRTMLIVLLMPVIQVLLFGFAMSTEVTDVRVAVVAPHRTEGVRQAVRRIAANPVSRFAVMSTARRSTPCSARAKRMPWRFSPRTTTGG